MTEADTIAKAEVPATPESLLADLHALGLAPGQVVLVHSSLSAMGWVAGGAQAVVMALMRTLTDAGTLVMPAYTGGNSEPSLWREPPVQEAWWQIIRDHMPAFDRRLTPSRQMGAIAELFRTTPDVSRSNHPACSFSAWGRYAHAIIADHRLNSPLGEDSPLARVYDLDGKVLLLGVGHDRNSSLHLAEHRAEWPAKRQVKQGAAVQFGNGRQWVQFDALDYDSGDFPEIGWDFVQSGQVKTGQVACAKAQLMEQPALVDFATDWISRRRG
jgi:aminoglycoside 3-N-acetyltransferase